jgi:hypothetical protein
MQYIPARIKAERHHKACNNRLYRLVGASQLHAKAASGQDEWRNWRLHFREGWLNTSAWPVVSETAASKLHPFIPWPSLYDMEKAGKSCTDKSTHTYKYPIFLLVRREKLCSLSCSPKSRFANFIWLLTDVPIFLTFRMLPLFFFKNCTSDILNSHILEDLEPPKNSHIRLTAATFPQLS